MYANTWYSLWNSTALSLSLCHWLIQRRWERERERERQTDRYTNTHSIARKEMDKQIPHCACWMRPSAVGEGSKSSDVDLFARPKLRGVRTCRPKWSRTNVGQGNPNSQRTWTCQPQVTRTCMSTANDKLSARRWFGTCRLVRSEPVLTNHLNNHEAYEPYLTDGAYSASVSPSPGRLPCPAWAAQAQPDSSSRSSAAGFSTYRPAWAWRFPTDPKTASPKAGWKVWG